MNAPEKIHPTVVAAMLPDEELGRQIVALRYDLTLEVLRGMVAEAKRQHDGDLARGRVKLAAELANVHAALEQAMDSMVNVVQICRPHIEAEKAFGTSAPEPAPSAPALFQMTQSCASMASHD